MVDATGPDIETLEAGVLNRDRRLLAQAITLVESTREDHQKCSDQMIASLLPTTGNSIRLGITGTPGVGKSTFIEALGLEFINEGHRVAVLTIDPSSIRGGGSILGDKTRMQKLSTNASAFIRATPNNGALGGVSRNTREAIILCEASGYNIVIVETVGVGQSEVSMKDMVDMFILLVQPASGDELQGIKRGVVEIADLLVINKADGALLEAAKQAQADYKNALTLSRPLHANWVTPVITCSALLRTNISKICNSIQNYHQIALTQDTFVERRRIQAIAWMWSDVMDAINHKLHSSPKMSNVLRDSEKRVASGELTSKAGSKRILDALLKKTIGS
jgi:LAO/AO transport system kinase